jgi:N-alpha-acetyltransferase 15/16, NatA auxiliary subunit
VSTPPDIPTPVSVLLASSLERLIPAKLSLETFNNEFIQRHTNSARAIFAAARASRLLDASDEAIEYLIFGMLTPEVQSDFQVYIIARWCSATEFSPF